ncbi:MAG: RNA pseudouridine synthase [Bacteroidetes bacterium]|nr:MAG: RNA pseudouridine synthase [Bacteroidota bacterium]
MKKNNIDIPPLSQRILYEDNHIIAVNKYPSEIVQKDKTGDMALNEKVKDYIKETYHKPGNVFLGIPHRIDRPVSGVVIFAKTSKALSRLSDMFRNKEIQKTYHAVVENCPPENEGVLIHYLRKNERLNKSFAINEPKGGYKKCELKYRLAQTLDRYFLLEIEPLTGRHHQIRVQLAAIGCVIKGDLKYGAKRPNKDASICLHARKIAFLHPVKKEPLLITAEYPKRDIWKYL